MFDFRLDLNDPLEWFESSSLERTQLKHYYRNCRVIKEKKTSVNLSDPWRLDADNACEICERRLKESGKTAEALGFLNGIAKALINAQRAVGKYAGKLNAWEELSVGKMNYYSLESVCNDVEWLKAAKTAIKNVTETLVRIDEWEYPEDCIWGVASYCWGARPEAGARWHLYMSNADVVDNYDEVEILVYAPYDAMWGGNLMRDRTNVVKLANPEEFLETLASTDRTMQLEDRVALTLSL